MTESKAQRAAIEARKAQRAAVKARIRNLTDDQLEGFGYLQRRHWRMLGGTGARWLDRDGAMVSFRTAVRQQVQADMDESR